MVAFFDASALIYLIEGAEPFAGKVRAELARLEATFPRMGAAVSRLSWLECRVGPMKSGRSDALAALDAFFAKPDLRWIELDRQVIELATAIRVQHGLRTPDALQAASCLQLGPAHTLLTGDRDFARVHGLNVQLLAA